MSMFIYDIRLVQNCQDAVGPGGAPPLSIASRMAPGSYRSNFLLQLGQSIPSTSRPSATLYPPIGLRPAEEDRPMECLVAR